MDFEAMLEDGADVNIYFHDKRTYAEASSTAQKYAEQLKDPKTSVCSSDTQDLRWILVKQFKPDISVIIFFDDEPT